MDNKKQIWENNLEFAQVLDDIVAEKHKYSHDALCDLIKMIATYLRQTGHDLERYNRSLEQYLEFILKMP